MSKHIWCHKHKANCGGAWRVVGGAEDACTDCNCPVSDHGERKRPVICSYCDKTIGMTLIGGMAEASTVHEMSAEHAAVCTYLHPPTARPANPQEIIASVDQTPRITLAEFQREVRYVHGLAPGQVVALETLATLMLATELELLGPLEVENNHERVCDSVVMERAAEVRKELE